MEFIPVMVTLIFQSHYSYDPSEIILIFCFAA